jgi:2-C-methyl-D-erythritol 4-phosphate cytidylyltransferase
MTTAAILLCAGRGERLGAGVEKALAPLAGRPLFLWSLEALERCAAVDGIVVVGPVRKLQDVLAATGFGPGKVVAWTEGGRARQDSVAHGLRALPAGFDLVAVHDSARALIAPALVARVVADAVTHGAAIAAVPLEDTLKRASLGRIEDTVPRAALWRAQTPQVFRREWLEAAHGVPASGGRARSPATDDAALVEALGHAVFITEGDALNFKITTAQDLALAGAWLARRED